MEQLKSCGICKVSIVGMSTQKLVGVCSIFEGQICGEVPETAYFKSVGSSKH